MPFTHAGDATVHWIESGHGPALVLLHGLGGDISFWDDEAEFFQQNFRVIRIDFRGSGRSPASALGHSIDDLADDIAVVLDAAGVSRASLVGFSMGGNAAQAFAIRHPDRLDQLVLASTFARMNPQARLFLDAVLDVYETGASARQMFDLICPWLFSIEFIADETHADYFVYPEDDPNEQPMDDWRKLYRAQQLFDSRGDLQSIAARTLVLVGDQDRLVSVDDAQLLADHIPNAKLDILPTAGHLINVEEPTQFRTAIGSFLAEHQTYQ
jgi:3-oxoadipate enol-lactonase